MSTWDELHTQMESHSSGLDWTWGPQVRHSVSQKAGRKGWIQWWSVHWCCTQSTLSIGDAPKTRDDLWQQWPACAEVCGWNAQPDCHPVGGNDWCKTSRFPAVCRFLQSPQTQTASPEQNAANGEERSDRRTHPLVIVLWWGPLGLQCRMPPPI